MNSLIILPSECKVDGSAVITGARARYVTHYHDLKAGLRVAASLFGGGRGSAFIRELSDDRIELELHITESPMPREKFELIVAVPRPQTVKKVIQLSSVTGIERLQLVAAGGVVKSYLQSKSLQKENIEAEVIKGLEQAGDSIPPEIRIWGHFTELLGVIRSREITEGSRFVADTKAGAKDISDVVVSPSALISVAVGPESGWTPEELADFKKLEFLPITLGPRMYRVEIAAAFLLSQLQLKRKVNPQ